MNIYKHNTDSNNTYWLEIDETSVRIPFEYYTTECNGLNVVLYKKDVMVGSLWNSGRDEFLAQVDKQGLESLKKY